MVFFGMASNAICANMSSTMATHEHTELSKMAARPDRAAAEETIKKYGFKVLGIERNGEVAQAIQSFYELKVDDLDCKLLKILEMLGLTIAPSRCC
jgi:hypothetical protein